jgi:hypothetical protein
MIFWRICRFGAQLTHFSSAPKGCSLIIGRRSRPRLGMGEKRVVASSVRSSSESAQSIQRRNWTCVGWYPLFPTMHKRILLAQYSLLHHSTSRRRVSRPTEPPSASDSLLVEAMEGAGEGTREGMGERPELRWVEEPLIIPLSFPLVFNSFAAIDRLSRCPLPNFDQTCPGWVKCLFNWKIRHKSAWWFFLCSESTALSSRKVHEGANNGEWKKPEKRSRAPVSAEVATLK